jgi:hypothetical protein
MKYLYLITLIYFSVLTNKKSVAQTTGVSDTLSYLQTIVANKSQFIGQPFSVLYSTLQVSIKYFTPFGNIAHDKRKETSTEFSFYFPQTANEIYLTYPSLRISWQPYLDNTIAHSLFNQYSGGWFPQVLQHYSVGIISDIQIRE